MNTIQNNNKVVLAVVAVALVVLVAYYFVSMNHDATYSARKRLPSPVTSRQIRINNAIRREHMQKMARERRRERRQHGRGPRQHESYLRQEEDTASAKRLYKNYSFNA